MNFKRCRVLALQVLFSTKHKLPCFGDIVRVEGGMLETLIMIEGNKRQTK